MKDTVTLIPPFDHDYIRASLERLTIWGALSGTRGQAPPDLERLVSTIGGIARVGLALKDELSEFECNPVIVTPPPGGRGRRDRFREMTGEPLIDVKAVSKTYDTSDGPVLAVDTTTLRLGTGEFVSIVDRVAAARQRC